ncbi:MAG: virginiamycin B lyase family protein [Isosphaeraceae bacterium]
MSFQDRTDAATGLFPRRLSHAPLVGRRRTRSRQLALESLESRQLLSTTITDYPLPSGSPAQPADIVAVNGKLWFTMSGNAIGSVDLSTNPPTITIAQNLPTGSMPTSITADQNGNVWFTELTAGQIGELSTTNPSAGVTSYGTAQGMPANARPYGITTDASGNIWFTDLANNALGEINASTGTVTEIPVPNTMIGFKTFDSLIVAGPGGKLYFTEVQFGAGNPPVVNASGIGIFNPATSSFTQVALPTGNGSYQEPFGLAIGPDHNVWFGESGGTGTEVSALGLILNPASSNPTLSEPANLGLSTAAPWRITAGPDGNIWFSVPSNRLIGMVQVQSNPANDTVSTFNIPTNPIANPLPSGITAGPDGNVWFADGGGAIGKAALDTQLVLSGQPPAVVTTGEPFPITAKVVYTDNTSVLATAYRGNVTATLNGSGTISGGIAPVQSGVASFNLAVNQPGSGDTLTFNAAGLASVTTRGFSAVNPVLAIASQPTGTLNPGSPFGVVVYVADAMGGADTAFTGSVTLQLSSNPGGSTLAPVTVPISAGVASFYNLSLNNPGTGYALTASATGLTSVTTVPFNISAPAPLVQSPPTVLLTQRRNGRGRPIGRPILSGYQFIFDMPMSASAANPASYQVAAYVRQRVRVRVGRRVVVRNQLVLKPIAFSVSMPAGNTVQILTGRQPFALGGQITLVATGVTSAQGGLLDGNGLGQGGVNGVYAIGPRGLSIRYSG